MQLALELILARYIAPKEYGIIAMAMIFITVGTLFSESGFSNSLIHNQNRNEDDFSTAFYINIGVASAFVLIIGFMAPIIARYFDSQVLTDVLKVSSLSILFNALVMVPKTKLNIKLDFKTQTKISFFAMFFAGSLSVFLAVNGYGVWSLVALLVSQSIFVLIGFCIFSFWLPKLVFSKSSFRRLFGFGSHVLLAGVIQNVYVNLYNVVIGKQMTTSALGLYTKSNQFTFFPASLFSTVFQRVTFPLFSSYQNDSDKVFSLSQQFTRVICMAFFPAFVFLAVFAEPLVFYGLSEEWIQIVPIIQLLAIAYMFQPIIVNNMLLLQVKNNSKLFFLVELITKIIGVIILLCTYRFGILYLCYGLILQLVLQLGITSYFSAKLLNKNFISQLIIIIPFLVLGVGIWAIIHMLFGNLPRISFLLYGSLVFFAIYIGYYFLFLKSDIRHFISLMRNK